MKNINNFTKQFVMYVCLFGLLIAGVSCEKDEPVEPVEDETEEPAAEADLVNFNNVKLSSKQEVPLNRSDASGTYHLEYDKNSKLLSYTIDYAGTNPTAMHFHKGAIGEAGDVAAEVEGPYSSGMEGSITLTEAQEEDLLAGLWYLNVHSDEFAAGEIRGQAVMENQVVFSNIDLSGLEEVPANNSAATGIFNALYDKSSKELSYTVSLEGITATAMHLHNGVVGVNGDVVAEITGTGGTATLTVDQETDLLEGNLYLNVHSEEFPAGELRGQVVTDEKVVFSNALSGDNEVPASGSAATGTFYGEYDNVSKTLSYTIVYEGVTPTAMHFHKAAAGENGDVEVAVEGPYSSGMVGSVTLTDTQEADLLEGLWYLNVHSEDHPAGETRAQVVK